MRNRSERIVLASLSALLAATGCSNDAAPPAGDNGLTAALVSIQNNFDDGTAQGWMPRGPVTLTSTTEQAFAGTNSLKTTGRTAGFHGPSLNLTGQLAKGATYQVGVSVRLVAGEAPTTIRVTMQRSIGATDSFDTIAQNTNVTDAA
jgi:endo-1,4-beta-xylanase